MLRNNDLTPEKFSMLYRITPAWYTEADTWKAVVFW